MSTVAEIKKAIPSLTLDERAEVARCLSEWQDNANQSANETPPRIHDKLAEAERGSFAPGDRSNISKILSSLK